MTPPSPKKEFVEMAENVFQGKWLAWAELADLFAKSLQSVDAKAREEEAEECVKIIEFKRKETMMCGGDPDELMLELIEEILSRHPKPEKEERT